MGLRVLLYAMGKHNQMNSWPKARCSKIQLGQILSLILLSYLVLPE